MVLDVHKLKLHHAIGKEATRHLRGRNIGLKLSVNPGANTLVNYFWLSRDQTVPENHNIMLMHGDPPYAVIRYEYQWETRNIEEALSTVFNSDAIKLYVFLDNGVIWRPREGQQFQAEVWQRQRQCQMASTANYSGTGSKVWQSSCTRSHWDYMLRRLQRVLLALWIIAVSKHMPPIGKK